ncbi:hypothetical protein JTB14_003546 [Gonioctena quinquepunctata]|nr:hypothetical protein JTB14_003546 [Gonioctena quinquepunctata]
MRLFGKVSRSIASVPSEDEGFMNSDCREFAPKSICFGTHRTVAFLVEPSLEVGDPSCIMGDERRFQKSGRDAVEYLYSERIEADSIALPPEVDEPTDEELLDEENPGLPVDIAGFVELQTQDSEESSEDDNVPLAHLVSAPKKPKKETPEKLIPKKTKIDPSYEPFEPEHEYFEKDENSLRHKTVVDMFEQFFHNGVYDMIVEETM